MFKLVTERLTWLDVEWKGRTEDGKEVKNKIRLKVVLVDKTDFQAQLRRELEQSGSEEAAKGIEDFIVENSRGWERVGDEDGNPLEFNEANLRAMLQVPGFEPAVGRAYGKAWTGQDEVRKGN